MSDREQPPLTLPVGQYLTGEPSEVECDRLWAKIQARRAARGHEPADAASATLALPLAQSLLQGEELSAERARVWRGVLARVRRPQRARPYLARARDRALRGQRVRFRRPFLAFASMLSLAACALLALSLPGAWRQVAPAAGAPLLRADGEALGLMEASEQSQIVRLSDASEIRLARGARLEPLQSSGTRFEVLLARGSAEFSVTPGGPRRWLVEAGAARVEVVGTVFRVERGAEDVVVSVSRGAVLVRGENVPGWVQRVTAGERLRVTAHAVPAPETAAPSEPAASESAGSEPAPSVEQMPEDEAHAQAAPAAAPQPASAPKARSARGASRSTLGRLSGGPQERYAALGPQGMARETAAATSIEELLQLADIARLSGHPRDAVPPLSRALLAFRASPQAALAAFTLGRIELDQLEQPKSAADAFERAIALHLPRALLPDCYRRLAEAYGRAGDISARERAERRFHEAFAADAGAQQGPVGQALQGVGGAAP